MTLRSRFTGRRSLSADVVSSLPVVSSSSDHPYVVITQPIVSSSNSVPNADHYSNTIDIVLLGISLVLLVIVIGVYVIRKYFYPPAEINATRQQAVHRRLEQQNEGRSQGH
ncbi:hypothetical protein O6H91_18G072400 [Diphasiastrum complanatum]|uniref:Uncharacterized protein n=1 Tax=Diphasiastrum complanatum TaxID=34168 RepID=A0ACC2B2L3_DIPCM|nr:hypothetical protein O6H91_18G072400 [Diphasiastrum complanatum]